MLDDLVGQAGGGAVNGRLSSPPAADRPPGRADPSLPAALPLLLQPARARPPLGGARYRRLDARLQRGGSARRPARPPLRRRADGARRHRRADSALRRARPLYQPHHLRGRQAAREKLEALPRRASTTSSFRCRQPRRPAQIASPASTAPTRPSSPSPPCRRSSACRSPSTPSSIAAMSARSRQLIALAVELGAQPPRDRPHAVLRLGPASTAPP